MYSHIRLHLCVPLMLEDTLNPIRDHNQLRYLGCKLHRRGASDFHEITGRIEWNMVMPNVDWIFDTDDVYPFVGERW
jgi:hypothetical protein